jgi:hypothetical protein
MRVSNVRIEKPRPRAGLFVSGSIVARQRRQCVKMAEMSETAKNLTVDRDEFDALLGKLIAAPQTAKNGIKKPIAKKRRTRKRQLSRSNLHT